MRLTILFILLCFSATAQIVSNRSPKNATPYVEVNYATDRSALVFGDSIYTSNEFQSRGQRGTNLIIAPVMRYDSGRTVYVYQVADTGPEAARSAYIVYSYDDRYGLSFPMRVRRRADVWEGHHRPALAIDEGRFYMLVEKEHNIQPQVLLKTRYAKDDMIWELTDQEVGVTPTYPKPFKVNNIWVNLTQIPQEYDGIGVNRLGKLESDWPEAEQVATISGPNEVEHYISAIENWEIRKDQVIYVDGGRYSPTVSSWWRKFLIKTSVTRGGVRHYNWDETYSTDRRIDTTTFQTEYKYYDTGGHLSQGWVPAPALDNYGNFYDVSGDGGGGYDFIILEEGDASPTVKAISLPGSPTILSEYAAGGDPADQNGGCVHLLAISPTHIYAFFRIQDGSYAKIHMYKTVDQGDNWTDEGDILPGIDKNIIGLVTPINPKDIPDNKNFIIVASTKEDTYYTTLYVRKAAFGAIQDDDGDPYADVVPYTESEFNDLMVRSYMVESGKVTNTGTTCNSLIDQSASGQDATSSGSPVMDDGTTPTSVLMDGSDDAFAIPTTGLDLLEGTIFIVAKPRTGTASKFLTFSNTDQFLGYGKSSTNFTNFTDSDTVSMIGQETVSEDYHIFAFIHQNGETSDVLHFYDGALQERNTTTATNAIEGRFTDSITLTSAQIGNLVQGSTTFYNFDIKQIAISSTPMGYVQLRKCLQYLSDKHSITLHSHYR